MKTHLRSIVAFVPLAFAVAQAHSQTLTKFQYSERGYSGVMIVENEIDESWPVKPIRIAIETENLKTHHACHVLAKELTAARIRSRTELNTSFEVFGPDDESTGESLSIRFSRLGAVIEISGVFNSSCGFTAAIAGKWNRSKR